MRQICVHEVGKDKNKPELWWDYVDKFDELCLEQVTATDHHKFTSDCAEDVADSLNDSVNNLWDELENCIDSYGGIGYELSRNNTKLDEHLKIRYENDIHLLPSFTINDFDTAGSWHCPLPVSPDTCNVYQAICSAYETGTEPE
eukprot:UN26655